MSMKKEKDHWYLEISIVETNKQTVDDEIEFFRFIQARMKDSLKRSETSFYFGCFTNPFPTV